MATESAEEEEGPFKKKIRYSNPDLKIVLQYEDNKDGRVTTKEEERWVHATVLATQSDFVDAALSIDMKEKQSMQLVFSDTTPELFDFAMKCLQDPVAAFNATTEDLLSLLKFYQKFQFPVGLNTCDYRFSKFFGHLINKKKTHETFDVSVLPLLDLAVDAAMAVEENGLKSTNDAAVFFGRVFFSSALLRAIKLEHLKKLHPYFKKKLIIIRSLREVDDDDFGSSLFPRLLLEHFKVRSNILR